MTLFTHELKYTKTGSARYEKGFNQFTIQADSVDHCINALLATKEVIKQKIRTLHSLQLYYEQFI